jgi:hypothetical protein
MDLFFQDPSVIPLPPEEVRIREMSVKPYPDGKRVRVRVELDPFQKRPSLEMTILNARAELVVQARVVETMARALEMTLHLREEQPGGEYTFNCLLYYQDAPTPEAVESAIEYPSPKVVDQRQVSFMLPSSHGSNPVTENL